MFKKFFMYISMPFKSDADIKAFAEEHPKAAAIAKVAKVIFSLINFYVDAMSINKILNMFGKGIKNFPDITKIFHAAPTMA